MREAMAWARHKFEELRNGIQEISKLGEEEEPEWFAQMTMNPDHGERHACEVAVRIANEDSGGEPVVPEQTQSRPEEGHYQCRCKDVLRSVYFAMLWAVNIK